MDIETYTVELCEVASFLGKECKKDNVDWCLGMENLILKIHREVTYLWVDSVISAVLCSFRTQCPLSTGCL